MTPGSQHCTLPIWLLHAGARLVWSSWGSEHIVYQGSSGETHYLNATGAAVLHQLGEGPASLDNICRYIAADEDLPADESFVRQVAAVLARFDELGLITRCDPPCGV